MTLLRRDWPLLALWLFVSAVLLWMGRSHVLNLGGWDPDDQLRMVQLRDFLNGQSWFDATQYRLNPPDGAPMHWSRLIELPLAAIVLLVRPLLGQYQAEMVAGAAVPLLCLGGIGWMLSRIAAQLGGRAAAIAAMLLTLIAPALLIQLRPMRIDHHGWQIFCAVLALWTLYWPSPRKAGLFMGAAMAVWTHISLEGAPMTAAFFLWLCGAWVWNRKPARLFWTVASFALASLMLFLGTQADGFGAALHCDTLSPAHIQAILGGSALLLWATVASPPARWQRLALLMAAGSAALWLLFANAPICAQGAFADLDPVVRSYWYVKISEGLPVWYQEPAVAVTLLTPLFAALLAFSAIWRASSSETRSQLAPLGFFLAYASILSLLVFRTVSVATAFTIVPMALWLGAAVTRYGAEPVLAKRLLLAMAGLGLLVSGSVAGTVVAAFAPKPLAAETKREAAGDACESVESVRALAKLRTGNIVAPFDMGPTILLTTQHNVLASSHHRNRKGMRDQIDIFRLPPKAAQTIMERHRIDYLVACPGEAELDEYAARNPNGLWAQLAQGNTPVWLAYKGAMGKGMKVWARATTSGGRL